MTSVPPQPRPAPDAAPEQRPAATSDASPPAAGPAPDTATPDAAADPVTGADAPSVEVAGRGGRGGLRSAAMRSLLVALLAGAVGAGLVLVAAGKTWERGYAAFGQTRLPVHASGTDTSALPGALALVGLASLVAVFAVRRVGRYVVAALLTLSGLGVLLTALTRRGDHGALDDAAASAAGLARATASDVGTTSWPWVSVAGGLLLLAAGLLALRYGRSWPAMSSRYDRPGARRPVRARAAASAAASRRPAAVDPDRAEDLWKALDRGEDPTEPAR